MPGPVAIYPLNSKHRANPVSPYNVPPGKTVGVTLADGPDGEPGGSYAFSGTSGSYIEFPGGSKLDTRYSITITTMIYPEGVGPIVHYSLSGWGTHLWTATPSQLYWSVKSRAGHLEKPISTFQLKTSQWNYIGATYDYSSGMSALWIGGRKVQEKRLEKYEITTNKPIRMGAVDVDSRYLKGRISCFQIYDRALAEDEMIAVKSKCSNTGKFNLPC